MNHDFSCFKGKSLLVTGGAGFIGSHIVDKLLKLDVEKIRILDNLSNGRIENIEHLRNEKRVQFIEGDIRNIETCRKAMEGIDYVSHQAALGSVPRSIKNPFLTNDVNITGFLNVIMSAYESGTVKRMVYAASSSTYGDHPGLPKVEDRIGKPLSPYAVTKYVNELYGDVVAKTYGFISVGLRYFNVFGPRQDANNAYAAVIPLFINHAINKTQPSIFGDGLTSRDFTYVENAVLANLLALSTENITKHEVFNIACGDQMTLNELWEVISSKCGYNGKPVYKEERKGDVKHSKADISKASVTLGYEPHVNAKQGIGNTVDFFLNK